MSSQAWQNKKVLVTGGTSGLGRALAEQLVQSGAQVAVVGRHANRHRPYPGITFIRGDVGAKNEVHRIHAEALSVLGGIDVLIHNASSLGHVPLRILLDTECETFEEVLQTNLIGPFRLSKLVVPEMILNHAGIVVAISSDAAVNAYPKWGAYSVSKAALDHLTRIFQAELSDTGVHFLALDPGDMDTPLHAAAVPDAERSSLHSPASSARLLLEQIATETFQPVRRSLR